MIIESIKFEYQRYKTLAEKAIRQVADEALHIAPCEGGNSIAVIMNHLSGNLKSRFTNFLTEDGEKSWRNRDQEFEEQNESRAEMLARWDEAWSILFAELDALHDADLGTIVRIRAQEMTVSDALMRSLSHAAFHVGQIVTQSRVQSGGRWKSLSIPKGKSQEFKPA